MLLVFEIFYHGMGWAGMPFADNLRYYLRQRHLTQEAFARKVNRRHCTVFRWLSGQTIPRLSTITIVANALGVAVSDLLDGTPTE